MDTAIPKYAGCVIDANLRNGRNQWAGRSISLVTGMNIFFDPDGDGIPDHTCIAEKCENGYVYTIEGNTTGCLTAHETASCPGATVRIVQCS